VGSAGEWSDRPEAFADNLAISHARIDALEAALAKNDAKGVGEAMFVVSTLIMHEASHWGKWKYNCCEIDGSTREEKGAVYEFNAYGRRFSYASPNDRPFRDEKAKQYYRQELGRYGSPTFGLSINLFNDKYGFYRLIKTGSLQNGQVGDPTLKANGDKEVLNTPYKPKETQKASTGNYSYSY
jgi:hypothetical protein